MNPSRVGSPLQDLYRTSIERYRSVVDCLKDDARSGGEPNLTMIDWQAMRSEEDAAVCIFRIATSYSVPADMARWFEIQGFDADIIAIPGSNLPAIVAVWLVKDQGVLFSSNIFDRWWKSLVVHSISASVTYDENNLATNSGIGFSAL